MSNYYLEAVTNPRGFGVELGRREMESHPPPPSINKILIRAGEEKALVLHGFLSSIYGNIPVGFLPPEWDEDAHRRLLMPQQIIAAFKTTIFNPDTFFGEAEPRREGWLVSLATDVHQYEGEVVLDKPKHITSKDMMMDYLLDLLGGDETRKFKATSSAAVLAKDLRYPSERGRGLVNKETHHFDVSPFTREEIEFYLYGIIGMDGSYPDSMREILNRLVSEYQLSDDEIKLLERGLTLQEIHSTNGGLRWLHPLFEHHIIAIDGVKQEGAGFELKRSTLFLILMGSSSKMAHLIGHLNFPEVWRDVDGSGSKNLYRQLNEDWREVVFLDRERVVILQSMTKNDIPEVSMLTTANLLNGSNHSVLKDEHRRAYASANSPEEFERTFLNDRNRFTLIVRSADGELVGYVLTRELQGDPTALEIRRIHTAKGWQRTRGIGGLMLDRVEDYTRENSYREVVVEASGNSQTFFEKHGFTTEGVVPAYQGVFENLGSSAPQVAKMRKNV